MLALFENPEIFKLLSLPLVAALVGWATNWLAVQLTFYPLLPLKLFPFIQWQGVIPRHAEKMASICVDQTIARFGDMHDVFLKLEPEKITEHIIHQLNPRIEEYVDEIMYEKQPVLWDNLPVTIKQKIYDWAKKQIPGRIEALVAEFGNELGSLVDIKALFVEELKKNRGLMVRIFQLSGEKEFRFIVHSGWLFGALFGVLLIPVWLKYQALYMLPIFSFLVGLATNWLALNIIFRPLNVRNVLGFKLQGLFLKRQNEVSDVWSRLIAEELITVEKVAHSMVFGAHAHRTRAIIQKHIRPILDQSGIFKTITQVAVGPAGYAELKKALNDKAVLVSVEPFHNADFNREKAPVVAAAMAARMKALTPREFQDVLRPAFQEEEWQLMLIGGLLGAVAGALQWLILFL